MNSLYFFEEEFERLLDPATDILQQMESLCLFLTGGTGFFGRWLLESIVWANKKHGLNVRAVVLSRNPAKFSECATHLFCDTKIRFHSGDVRNFEYPLDEFTHVIHGATTNAEETFQGQDPLEKFDILCQGTRRVLDFSVKCGVKRFLHLSSGSAFGLQPSEMTHIPEEYPGAPLTTDRNFNHSALGEGKRAAELFTTIYGEKYGIENIIARCFSFIGPGLPLDIHYAIGNFIRDGLMGGPIRVKSDGSPQRSYMYIADLVRWLWTILCLGESGHMYNVGSDQAISMIDLASLVASCFEPQPRVDIEENTIDRTVTVNRYVPSIDHARKEMGLEVYTSLENAIRLTIENNR